MEEAAREWTKELTRAWNDISHTTRRLQASFQDASARAVEQGYVLMCRTFGSKGVTLRGPTRSTCQTLVQPSLMLSSHFFLRDEPIPDPIKLLRRMAALELRIDQLRRDCIDVADGRNEIALAVTGVQVDNVCILRQVSDLIVLKEPETCERDVYLTIFFIIHYAKLSETMQPSPLASSVEISKSLDNWTSLASAVEEQHELFETRY